MSDYSNLGTGINYANLKSSTMGPLAGIGIATGLDLIGNVFGNRARKREARRQRQFDLDMWNRQNAYNTPKMQMKRLKDAGLNPALMYGQGTTGNANQAVKASVADMQNPLNSSGVASGIQLSLANSQKQLLKANALSTTLNAYLKTGGSKESATKYFAQNLENLSADTQQKKEQALNTATERAGKIIDNEIKDKTKAKVIEGIVQEVTNKVLTGDILNMKLSEVSKPLLFNSVFQAACNFCSFKISPVSTLFVTS